MGSLTLVSQGEILISNGIDSPTVGSLSLFLILTRQKVWTISSLHYFNCATAYKLVALPPAVSVR